MSVAISPSDAALRRARLAEALAPVRANGGIAASFQRRGEGTQIERLAERGGYRVKFPTPVDGALEAVAINTGGGVAGGDRVHLDLRAGERASATVATATAERIYRTPGPDAEIDVALSAGERATLAWLPQASILFSGARLRRRFEVDIAADARLVMAEVTVFGRIGAGEVMGAGLLHDVWRVRRAGRLVFAEAMRLDGDIAALLANPAVAGEARVMALLLCVDAAAADQRDAVRAVLAAPDIAATGCVAGVSAWNGLLVMRALAGRLDVVQKVLRRAVEAVKIVPVPQVWSDC